MAPPKAAALVVMFALIGISEGIPLKLIELDPEHVILLSRLDEVGHTNTRSDGFSTGNLHVWRRSILKCWPLLFGKPRSGYL